MLPKICFIGVVGCASLKILDLVRRLTSNESSSRKKVHSEKECTSDELLEELHNIYNSFDGESSTTVHTDEDIYTNGKEVVRALMFKTEKVKKVVVITDDGDYTINVVKKKKHWRTRDDKNLVEINDDTHDIESMYQEFITKGELFVKEVGGKKRTIVLTYNIYNIIQLKDFEKVICSNGFAQIEYDANRQYIEVVL